MASRADGRPAGSVDPLAVPIEDHARIDWEAAERSPEFDELVRRRRRFVLPATIFFLGWYFGFILLAGYAEGFMRESLYEGLTVGYALALTQFVMTWVLGVWYLRHSNRELDPLRETAARRALEATGLMEAHAERVEETAPVEPATRTIRPEERR